MRLNLLFGLGLSVALLNGCRTSVPPTASPVAHGPPGPTPEVAATAPPQTAPPPAASGEDAAVAHEVRAALREVPGLNGAADHIRVKVNKGVVRLRGPLPPGADRAELLSRLEKIPGVDRIEDELRASKP